MQLKITVELTDKEVLEVVKNVDKKELEGSMKLLFTDMLNERGIKVKDVEVEDIEQKYFDLLYERKQIQDIRDEELQKNEIQVIKQIEEGLGVKFEGSKGYEDYVAYYFIDKESDDYVYLTFDLPNFNFEDFDDQTPNQKYRDKIEDFFQL